MPEFSSGIMAMIGRAEKFVDREDSRRTAAVHRQDDDEAGRRAILRERYAFDLNNPSPTVRVRTATIAAREVTNPEEREWLAQEVNSVAQWKDKLRQQRYSERGYVGRFAANFAENLSDAGESFLARFRSVEDITKLAMGKGRDRATIQFMGQLEGAKQVGNPDVRAGAGRAARWASAGAGVSADVIGSMALAKISPTAVATAWAGIQYPQSRDDFVEAGLSGRTAALAAAPVAAATGAIEAIIPDPTKATKGVVNSLIKRVAEKTVPKIASSAAGRLTQRTAHTGIETAGRFAMEAGVEEAGQAAVQEAGLTVAGAISKDVEQRDPRDIYRKAIEGAAEAGPALLPWIGGGGVGKATQDIQRFRKLAKGSKQAKIDADIIQHAKEGKTPSRGKWRREWGLPLVDVPGKVRRNPDGSVTQGPGGQQVPRREVRNSVVASLAEEKIEEDQIRTAYEGVAPTPEQWETWGMPRAEGLTAKRRMEYLQKRFQQAEDSEARVATEDAQGGPTEPGATEGVPTPDQPGEAAAEPGEAPAAAQEASEEQGALAPDPGDDKVVQLSKVASTQIRDILGITALGEEAKQTFEAVMAKVSVEKQDDKALDVAREVLKTRRQTTTYEHAAMVLRAGKLLNEKDVVDGRLAASDAAGDKAGHDKYTAQSDAITDSLDLLTEASDLAGRESARALSIRRLRLNRENWDVASMLGQIQKAKGVGVGITKKVKSKVNELSREIVKGEKQAEKIKKSDAIEAREKARLAAEEVIRKYKPKGGTGQNIKEKAAKEREEIKAAIRALGHRVNDITGLGAEGTWLVGRLAITYVKSGVGEMVDLVEQIKYDMPDLALSDIDVYEALVARDPRIEQRQRTQAEKQVAKFKSMARMLLELDSLAKGIAPGGKKKTKLAIDADIKQLQKKLTAARTVFYEADFENAKLERAIDTLNRLWDDLKNARTRLKEAPKERPPQLQAVHDKIQDVRSQIRVKEQIAKLEAQLRTGKFDLPTKRQKREISPELEKQQIKNEQLKREFKQMVKDSVPLTLSLKGAGRVAQEAAAILKSIKATADISFTMRQNLWQVFSHPLRTTGIKQKAGFIKKAIKSELTEQDKFSPSLSAFFSEYSADQIHNSLMNGENGFLYQQVGLAIMDASSPDMNRRSEVYRANVIERAKLKVGRFDLNIFGRVMKASSRHAVTIGNLVRTSAFDQFLENNPNATTAELRAFADYLNVSTGLGNLWKLAPAADVLQVVFFSPRFAASRFQTPFKVIQHWQHSRVRKEIAKDMMKFSATGSMVLMLAYLAGADVNFLDPDDPDWGKIRVGDQRVDIWGGFQQPARLLARLAKTPVRDKDDNFGPLEALGRFSSYKLSPIITVPIELATGKTAVGEKVGPVQAPYTDKQLPGQVATLARSFVPLMYEDIYEAYKIQGPGAAVAAAVLAGTGVGVSTYKDSKSTMQRKVRKLKEQGLYDEAADYKTSWKEENPGK